MLIFLHIFQPQKQWVFYSFKKAARKKIGDSEIKKLKYVPACVRFCHGMVLNIEH